jgi:hypothetical protein
LAKIFKQPGNNIEASRRGAGDNGHCGNGFWFPEQGRVVNFPFPGGCVLNDNARGTRLRHGGARTPQTE